MSQNLKISGLTAYSSFSTSDLIEIVDVSDTTMAATGTNKKCTINQLNTYLASVISGGDASIYRVPAEYATLTLALEAVEDGVVSVEHKALCSAPCVCSFAVA